MYYVGIDIGSTASKTVVTGDKEIKFVLPTGNFECFAITLNRTTHYFYNFN